MWTEYKKQFEETGVLDFAEMTKDVLASDDYRRWEDVYSNTIKRGVINPPNKASFIIDMDNIEGHYKKAENEDNPFDALKWTLIYDMVEEYGIERGWI